MIVLNGNYQCVPGCPAGQAIEQPAPTRNVEANLQSEIWKCPGGVQ
jgi:hypothetical protein